MTWHFRRAAVAQFRSFSFFLPAMFLIALAGCATVTPPPAPKLPVPDWESSQLIESIKQRDERFRSLRALAQIAYAGPEGKHGFQEAVLVQRPDRLRLDTLTFLGAILIFTANDKELIGYHPREGVVVRGAPTRDNLRRYTKIPLELNEITKLLMGLAPIDGGGPWKQEGNSLILSPQGRKRDVLTFASHQPVPTKWERFNDDGKVELNAQFSDYVPTPAGLFPLGIVLEAPLQKKKLGIRYQEPELNASIPPGQFTQQIPAHAKEAPIEAVGD